MPKHQNQALPNAPSLLSRLRLLAASGTARLRTDSHWEAWLRRAERFGGFGFENTMLIWAQAPNAVLLNTYEGWHKAGRQVMAGSTGIRLITAGKAGDERVGSVFDLLQTEGKPVRVPQPRSALADVGADGHAWRTLRELAGREGFRVWKDAAEDSSVDWADHLIYVRAGEEPVAALAHQVAHVLLRHDVVGGGPVHSAVCQGLRKVEADSVTFLIERRFGMDTSAIAFPYITSWAGEDPRTDRARIIGAAGTKIIGAASKAFACIDTSGQAPARLVTGPRKAKAAASAAAVVAEAAPAVHASPGALPVPPLGERPRALALAQLEALRFYGDQVRRSWVPAYLEGRGFDAAARRDWSAGYAPGTWTAVTEHLRSKGFSDEIIEAAGLARRASRHTLIDTFRDRAVFPVRAPDGTVRGFIGRRAPGADPETVPKYLNTRETEIYRKGQLLFGLSEGRDALAAGATPVIVEGPMDAMAVTEAGGGKYVGVAPCGTAFTAGQMGELARACDLRTAGVIAAFDTDEAGQKAAVRAYDLLVGATGRPLSLTFGAGEDPASVLETRGAQALRLALDTFTRPLGDIVVDRLLAKFQPVLESIEGRFNARDAVAPVIARMAAIEWPRQTIRVAAKISLPPTEIADAVARAMPGPAASGAAPRAGPRPGRAAAQAAQDLPGPPAVARPTLLPPDSDHGVPRRPVITSAQARRSMQ
jgi:DNA primase